MKITIDNFRGIRKAEIMALPVALIAGENGAGKTSIALAAHALLARQPLPFGFIRKKDAKDLVKDGSSKGFAQLETSNGNNALIEWPGCELKASNAEGCPAVLTGPQSLLDMEPKARIELLKDLINAHPTREDFMAIEGVDQETLEKLWQFIEVDGWQATLRNVKEHGARHKGAWEQITGENFGTRKAQCWYPEGYINDPSFDQPDAEMCILQALEQAESEVEKLTQKGGARSAQKEELERIANSADIKELNKQLEEASTTLRSEKETLEKLQAKINELPPILGHKAHDVICPACNTKLEARTVQTLSSNETVGVKLFKSEDNVDDERTRNKEKSAQLLADLQRCQRTIEGLEGTIRDVKARIAMIEQARQKISELGETSADQEAEFEKTKQTLTAAKAKHHAFIQFRDAKQALAKIEKNNTIQQAMSPNDIPKRALSRAIDDLNKRLASLSKTSGWGKLMFDEDIEITISKRPYLLCSESEQWRADALLRIALAEDEDCIILDRADILTGKGRNQLFKLLAVVQCRAIVCMTMNNKDQVPDLEAAGFGNAYWIENGEAGQVIRSANDKNSQAAA